MELTKLQFSFIGSSGSGHRIYPSIVVVEKLIEIFSTSRKVKQFLHLVVKIDPNTGYARKSHRFFNLHWKLI
jgi:hypothetical protein